MELQSVVNALNRKRKSSRVEKLVKNVKKGDKGESPVFGIDYFTEEQVKSISQSIFENTMTQVKSYVSSFKEDIRVQVIPKKGIDYFDGLNGKKGDKGDIGAQGLTPEHRFLGTKLQFKNSDGTWGNPVDLKGLDGKDGKDGVAPEHEVVDYKIRFKNPDGTWGEWINFGLLIQLLMPRGGGATGILRSVRAGTGIHIDNSDPENPEISTTITQYTDEMAQDAVGNAVGAGLSYNDVTGAISSTITQYTDEQAQDAVGGIVDSTLVYVDGTPVLKRAPITGDISVPDGSNAATLATVNSNVGTFGSASQVATFTVNAKGLITAASNTSIAIASTAITDFTEASQDAVGGMVDSTLVYVDATPVLKRAPITGDITIPDGSNTSSISAGVIIDADVNASAAIALTKLAATTISRALVSDSSGFITVSATTSTEIGYVNGVTSAIQTQLDNKQPLDSDLTTIAGLTATTDNFIVSVASAWASRTPTQVRTTLGLGTAALVNTDLADLNEATIEGAIDTLANLTSVQGLTVTLADAGADAFFAWDDSAGAYQNISAADARTAAGLVAGGAGDIWVEKAGDTMTGALNISLASGNSLIVDTTTLVVDATNNFVGIGTASPTSRLHIAGNASAATLSTSGIGLRVVGGTFTDTTSSGTVASVASYSFAAPTFASTNPVTITAAASVYIGNSPSAGTNTTITSPWSLWVDAGYVRFDDKFMLGGNNVFQTVNVTGTTQVNLDNQILSNSAAGSGLLQMRFANTGSGVSQVFGKSRSATVGTNTIVQDTDIIGNLTFVGADGTDYVEGARIRAAVNGTPATGSVPMKIDFLTAATGDTSASTIRMTVLANGNVGVGVTVPNSLFQVAGTVAAARNMQVDTSGRVTFRYDDNSNQSLITLSNRAITAANQGTNITFQIADTAAAGINAGRIAVLSETTTFASTTADSYMAFSTSLDASLTERMRITSAGRIGIGTTAPDKIMEVNLGTADAFRLTYNDANGSATTYVDTTVSSAGLVTFTAAGSAPTFTFAQDVSVPDEVYGSGWNASLEVPTKNAVYDKIESVLAVPTVSVYNTTSQSINNTTFTTITFNSELFDTSSMHDTSSNTSRLVAPVAGYYRISAHMVFDVNATGRRILKLLKNGSDYSGNSSEQANNVAGGYTIFDYSKTLLLAANDYIEVQVYQSSGGALSVLGSGSGDNQTSYFELTFIRP